MAASATRRRLACRARRVRRERGRRAGGAWVRRTRSDGRAPRSCVRSARFVSSTIRVGIPEADWADLGAAAELTPSGARDARSGRRTSCPVDLAVQQSDDPLAGESSTRHGSAQRLATVPLRYESGRDGRRSRWDDTRKCRPALSSLLLRQRERTRPPNRLGLPEPAHRERGAPRRPPGAAPHPARPPLNHPVALPRPGAAVAGRPRRWQAANGPSSPSGSLTRPP